MNDKGDIFEMMMPVIIFFLLMVGVIFLYNKNALIINTAMLAGSKAMLYPFAPFFAGAEKGIAIIERANPAILSWDQVSRVWSYASAYLRWISIPISVFIVYRGYSLGLGVWNRRMMLRQLIENNVETFPSIAPAARIDILSLSQSHGPWRTPEHAIQWAVKHKLLARRLANGKYRYITVDGIYDKKWVLFPRKSRTYSPEGVAVDKRAAALAYIHQLGPRLPADLSALPAYIRGLAAAFILYGHGERERGYKLLAHMSLSYESEQDGDERLDEVQEFSIDIDDADDVLSNLDNYPQYHRATSKHDQFISTWLVALLDFAKDKGELASSRWIWLRPVNRALYAATNQHGGKMPHFEAAAIWAHMDAEEVMGKSISTPEIRKAVKMLDYELDRENWITLEKRK